MTQKKESPDSISSYENQTEESSHIGSTPQARIRANVTWGSLQAGTEADLFLTEEVKASIQSGILSIADDV